jgi:hypothetical protein
MLAFRLKNECRNYTKYVVTSTSTFGEKNQSDFYELYTVVCAFYSGLVFFLPRRGAG